MSSFTNKADATFHGKDCLKADSGAGVAPVFLFGLWAAGVGGVQVYFGDHFFLLGFDFILVDLGYSREGVEKEVFAYGVRSLVRGMKVFLSGS